MGSSCLLEEMLHTVSLRAGIVYLVRWLGYGLHDINSWDLVQITHQYAVGRRRWREEGRHGCVRIEHGAVFVGKVGG
jgi:hypothetical protein